MAEEGPSLEVSEQQEPKGYHQVVRGSGRIINKTVGKTSKEQNAAQKELGHRPERSKGG